MDNYQYMNLNSKQYDFKFKIQNLNSNLIKVMDNFADRLVGNSYSFYKIMSYVVNIFFNYLYQLNQQIILSD